MKVIDKLFSVDDVVPSILSYLTIQEIVTFASTVPTCSISNASFRDLILVYPWNTIIPHTQVDNIETNSLCLTSSTKSNDNNNNDDDDSTIWYKHFIQTAKRDQSIIVVDLGSYQLKAGFNTDTNPSCVLETSVILGKEAATSFGPTTQKQDIWHHVILTLLQILGVQVSKTKLCIVLKPFDLLSKSKATTPKPVPMNALKNIAQICLDSIGVHSVRFLWAPECTLPLNQECGIVYECGQRMSYCTPVQRHGNGTTSMHGIGRGNGSGYGGDGHLARRGKGLEFPTSTLCGLDLTLYMQSQLLCTQNVSVTLNEARQLKEKECYCRARKSKWMPTGSNSFLLQGEAQIIPSSGKEIVLTTERFAIPEVLLNPIDTIGKEKSVIDLVQMVMRRVTIANGENGPTLYTIGGSMEFRDLSRRLEKGLKESGVGKVVNLGQFGAWKGAALYGEGVKEDWIYEMKGMKEKLQRMKRSFCTG